MNPILYFQQWMKKTSEEDPGPSFRVEKDITYIFTTEFIDDYDETTVEESVDDSEQ